MWIESHIELERHHKINDFRCAMGWSKTEAIGFLHRFWWLVLQISDSGDVTKFTPEFIAEELNLKVEAAQCAFDNMISTGWIDDPRKDRSILIVHDWIDYAGKYLREYKYRRNKQKWEKIEELHKSLKLLYMTQNDSVIPTVPYRTVPEEENFIKEEKAESPIPPQHDPHTTGIDKFEAAMNPVKDELEKALIDCRTRKGKQTSTVATKWREGIQLLAYMIESDSKRFSGDERGGSVWTVGEIVARYETFLDLAKSNDKNLAWVKMAGLSAFANNIAQFEPKKKNAKIKNSKTVEGIINPKPLTDEEIKRNEEARKAAFQKLRDDGVLDGRKPDEQ